MTSGSDRVIAAIQAIAARLSEDRGKRRAVYVWSTSRGLRDHAGALAAPDSIEDPTAAPVHAIHTGPHDCTNPELAGDNRRV